MLLKSSEWVAAGQPIPWGDRLASARDAVAARIAVLPDIAGRIVRAARDRRTLYRLRSLDDRLLRDIGVSRADLPGSFFELDDDVYRIGR